MEPVLQIVVGEMGHVHTELMCVRVREVLKRGARP